MADSQQGLFRGIYQFEDPSGHLLATKIPAIGSADLYDGTSVVVRPNQCAIFVYKGKVADLLTPGVHTLRTENLPVLTRLANWRFGFESPLQCELWFFSGAQFTALKWGTTNPVIQNFEGAGSIALRAFGQYNLVIRHPQLLFSTLIGMKTSLHIDEVRDFVQGLIAEVFASAMSTVGIKRLEDLGKSQGLIAKQIELSVQQKLEQVGLAISSLQVLSVMPPDEVLKALDEKAAMNVLGDGKAYLLYKAAATLESGQQGGGQDPLHMMMGLMLGRGAFGGEAPPQIQNATKTCSKCQNNINASYSFCPNCGTKI